MFLKKIEEIENKLPIDYFDCSIEREITVNQICSIYYALEKEYFFRRSARLKNPSISSMKWAKK